MSFRTVVISKRSKLDLKMGYLLVRQADETWKLFLDEINTLIIENPACCVTCCLLAELVRCKIKVIFCDEKHSPCAELLPCHGHSESSGKLREQIQWDQQFCRYFPFEINRKNLLNKLLSVLEKEALSPEFYDRTQRLLGQTEQWIYDLAFATDNELEPKGISIVSLLKAAGIEFREDYHSLSEKILAYMDMVSNYDLAKLFVFINARSFINDRNMELFTENCIKKGFSILLIDSSEHPRLSLEESHVIDGDLCEF